MAAAKKVETKKADEKKLVEGVVLLAVEEAVVDKSLKHLKLPATGELELKVKRLAVYFNALEKDKKAELYVCDHCKGCSTDDWTFCPFCGIQGDVDIEPEKGPAVKAEKPAEIVLKGPDGKKLTPVDLDKSLEEINGLKAQFGISAWQLGSALKENHDRELWKLRVLADGAPAYTNIREFWKEEAGISHMWAYKLMEVAAAFSKGDLQGLGVTKAWLILKAPEKNRAKLMKAAQGGATRGDLEDAVKKLSSRGGTSSGGGLPSDRRLTIALMPRRHTVKLYKRKTGGKDELSAPAKRLADDPHGTYATETVALDFRVSKDKIGELVLILNVRKL